MMKLNRPDNWVKRWEVQGSRKDSSWTVAINEKGEYGCSCPVWKYKRIECKHIIRIKAQERDGVIEKLPEKIKQSVKKVDDIKMVDFVIGQRIARKFYFED
jgi:hypothetical protein